MLSVDAGLSCPPEPQLWKFENAILNFSIFFAILTEIVSLVILKIFLFFKEILCSKKTHLLTYLLI